MKKIFLILSLFIIISLSCQTTEPGRAIEFEILTEDLVNNNFIMAEGYYYKYQFSNYMDKIHNIEEVLRALILSGVNLLDAWYKEGNSSCYPPNSQYVMDVIVEPDFILRTKFPSNYLLSANFIQVENTPFFNCGYTVRHFIPKYR